MSKGKIKTAVVLHGIFKKSFFQELKEKRPTKVYVLEGRPTLKTSQNTLLALLKHKITPILITDNMVGFLFYKNFIKEVCLAYQSLNQEGALCDIGALILGVLAKHHGVPVKIFPAAQKMKRLVGTSKDITYFKKWRVAPKGVDAYAPLVEWLPRKYVTKIFL